MVYLANHNKTLVTQRANQNSKQQNATDSIRGAIRVSQVTIQLPFVPDSLKNFLSLARASLSVSFYLLHSSVNAERSTKLLL